MTLHLEKPLKQKTKQNKNKKRSDHEDRNKKENSEKKENCEKKAYEVDGVKRASRGIHCKKHNKTVKSMNILGLS